jgi:hypothetical protein
MTPRTRDELLDALCAVLDETENLNLGGEPWRRDM